MFYGTRILSKNSDRILLHYAAKVRRGTSVEEAVFALYGVVARCYALLSNSARRSSPVHVSCVQGSVGA